MLQFNNLSIRRGTSQLFANVNFNIHAGQKAGITGANGTGKSSLFALIRGELEADEGEFQRPANWQIAHVAQQTPQDERAAIDYVLDGDDEFRKVEQQLEKAESEQDGEKLAHIHAQFE